MIKIILTGLALTVFHEIVIFALIKFYTPEMSPEMKVRILMWIYTLGFMLTVIGLGMVLWEKMIKEDK